MTDEWKFRTARGRGSVAGGELRVENSLAGTARAWWAERKAKGRFVFLFTILTTLEGFRQVVDAGRALAAGNAESWHLLVLAAFAFVALLLVRRARWSKTVPLRRIRSVRRVGDERVRVAYAERDDAESVVADVEIETPTEADADDAIEMLQLKGVRVGNGGDADVRSKPITFRERLAKKVE